MNLLINAHQAIGSDGLVEVITAGPQDRMVSITIRDTGCGISRENLDRIWDPFFTTKGAGRGIGLGLALTYNIVKRLDGEIQVKSSIGEGTRFTVLLPVSGK
jgi:two-component system, sporulation sensor kinase E